LEEVCKAFAIFGDKQKAIKLTLTRFDPATQDAFFNLYTKIDPTILPPVEGMKDQPAKKDWAGTPVQDAIDISDPHLKGGDTNYALNA
jgi:hypothetical protein